MNILIRYCFNFYNHFNKSLDLSYIFNYTIKKGVKDEDFKGD